MFATNGTLSEEFANARKQKINRHTRRAYDKDGNNR